MIEDYKNKPEEFLDFIQDWNKTHYKEHQDFINYINAMYQALGIKKIIKYPETFGMLGLEFELLESGEIKVVNLATFFEKNWQLHIEIYSALNEIAQQIYSVVLPKIYPTRTPDMQMEMYFWQEYLLHFNIYKAIEVLGGL